MHKNQQNGQRRDDHLVRHNFRERADRVLLRRLGHRVGPSRRVRGALGLGEAGKQRKHEGGREPESRDDGDPGRVATAGSWTSSVKPSDHCLILSGHLSLPGLEHIDCPTYV